MPKELVVADYLYDEEQGIVEIGWNSETGDVQVAIYARNPETQETIGRDEARFIHPDRRGINEMIRQLRRARDGAFGKDQ